MSSLHPIAIGFTISILCFIIHYGSAWAYQSNCAGSFLTSIFTLGSPMCNGLLWVLVRSSWTWTVMIASACMGAFAAVANKIAAFNNCVSAK